MSANIVQTHVRPVHRLKYKKQQLFAHFNCTDTAKKKEKKIRSMRLILIRHAFVASSSLRLAEKPAQPKQSTSWPVSTQTDDDGITVIIAAIEPKGHSLYSLRAHISFIHLHICVCIA